MNGTLDKIEMLIKNSGKNQSTVLRECGLNPTALSEWRKGKAKPSADALLKIANYFNVSLDWLFDRNEKSSSIPEEHYKELLDEFSNKLDKIPEDKRSSVEALVMQLIDTFIENKKK